MELWQKVLVAKEFLDTEHAGKGCVGCHGGDAAAPGRLEAHAGLVRDPTEVPPFAASDAMVCAECHEDEVATGRTSLHATLSTFNEVLHARAGDDPANWEKVDAGRRNHCAGCHASCGQCHVSRPNFAKKGFVSGHRFVKKPDMIDQCTACHGSRVGDEYLGDRGIGDAHYTAHGMDCMACHGAAEMHASGAGLTSRYQLPQMPTCAGCHEKDLGRVAQHADHAGKVQCQGCHSQDYVNCFSCHTGKDREGIAYFVNELETESFKLGRNYPGTGLAEKFVLVRHEPTDPEVFDFYVKDGFRNFDALPTWKRASPHNIQKRTWRNASCNHCHGERSAFLAAGDLLEYEKGANRPVVVADADVPARRSEDTFTPPAVAVRQDMLVTAAELHDLLGRQEAVSVVDARTPAAFAKGHLAGAVNVNAMAELRNPPDGTFRSMQLRAPAELAQLFGSRGLDRGTRVVVYDAGGLEAQLVALALARLGHARVAVLDGGIDAWEKEERLPLEAGAAAPALAKPFGAAPVEGLLLINRDVAAALESPGTVVLDVRSAAQYAGLRIHPLAASPGHLPKAVNLPVRGMWTPEGFFKGAGPVAWLLESRGITRDRKIVTTCNTAQQAAAAWFALRYLGYPDVVVHDGSWVSWERSPMMGRK